MPAGVHLVRIALHVTKRTGRGLLPVTAGRVWETLRIRVASIEICIVLAVIFRLF
jgi:hypothetical protein